MWFCSQVWWLSSSVELPRHIIHTIICLSSQEVALSRQGCLLLFFTVHCCSNPCTFVSTAAFFAWPLTYDGFLSSSLRCCTSWLRTSYFLIWAWHCLLSRSTYSAQFLLLELLYPFSHCVRFLYCLMCSRACDICWL